MAGFADRVRLLAYNLHAHEPVEQERRAASRFRASAARKHDVRVGYGAVAGQHQHSRPPQWRRRRKKNGPQSIGRSRGGLTTKLHLVAADARHAIAFDISGGQEGDAPWGRELLRRIGRLPSGCTCGMAMDRAYEGDATRELATELGFTPVVPPNPGRLNPWELDTTLYKLRNNVERFFRRIKEYRRIFTRYDKLDAMFMGFILFACSVEILRISVNTP
jgi:transposase